MLLLDTRTLEIDGITIFPDHADPAQFYYMPLAPHLTLRPDGAGGAAPQFSLIRFKGEAGVGGFLNFDVNLGLPPQRMAGLAMAVSQQTGLRDPPRLAPLPVVDGAIRLIMLGTESGAAPAAGGAAGGLRFVETINHAAKPSLYGDNQAAFSVQLTQAGVTTVLQALDGEILPIAVVYSLDYLGLRPAYRVRLSIDWDRVQKHMEESFAASFLVVSAEIGSAVDELIESRAIQFDADSFIDDSDDASAPVAGRRDAAISQVRAMITDAFFQPSLPPWTGDADGWSRDLQKAADVMGLIAGGPAAAAASKSMFSYKKMEYQRTDRKKLNVDFSERTTVRRTIHPQGHLAGLFDVLRAPGIDRARFMTDVDLDDPWFKRRRLSVFAQTDFATDRIASLNVRARYGGEPKNVILTPASAAAEFNWAGRLEGNRLVMPVELEFEVAFTGVDGAERPVRLVSQVVMEDGETRPIDPRTLYSISVIPVAAVNMPWDRYTMVEVHLRYADAGNGLMQGELLQLTKERTAQDWPVFVLDPSKRSFDYRLVFRAADNRDHDTGWRTTEDEGLTIGDPFPRKRELMVAAAVDWTRYSRCFVDITYDDEQNGETLQSLTFIEGDGRKSAVFEMSDPSRRVLRFSALLLGKDGTSTEVPASMTRENSIVIRADMKGRKIVEVRPPVDFPGQRLSKVTAAFSFEDFEANLSTRQNLEFEPGGPVRTFEYDFVRADRASYAAAITYVFDNGMTRTVQIDDGEDAVVQLRAPQ